MRVSPADMHGFIAGLFTIRGGGKMQVGILVDPGKTHKSPLGNISPSWPVFLVQGKLIRYDPEFNTFDLIRK